MKKSVQINKRASGRKRTAGSLPRRVRARHQIQQDAWDTIVISIKPLPMETKLAVIGAILKLLGVAT